VEQPIHVSLFTSWTSLLTTQESSCVPMTLALGQQYQYLGVLGSRNREWGSETPVYTLTGTWDKSWVPAFHSLSLSFLICKMAELQDALGS
jgi:hypothetical protein